MTNTKPSTRNVRSRVGMMGFSALTAGLVAVMPGCAGSGDLLAAKTDYAGAPPSTLDQSEVLNIQVFRNVTDLELTNTTARSFGPGLIWINERYSYPIDGLGIGESLDVPLRLFIDEFGDPFRAGGFFATREPDPVVLAQLESGGVLYGLLLGGDRIK